MNIPYWTDLFAPAALGVLRRSQIDSATGQGYESK